MRQVYLCYELVPGRRYNEYEPVLRKIFENERNATVWVNEVLHDSFAYRRRWKAHDVEDTL